MAITRFTGFGLAIAVLGWAILIGNLVVTPLFSEPGRMVAVAGLRADVFSLAQTTIFSGFALAVIGVLRSGFGALHRFFDAVLERASTPRPAPKAEVVAVAEPAANLAAGAPAVELNPERPAGKGRGPKTRNYTILDNGAVEVDTLLGTRVFASLDEARDYIR